MKIFRGCVLHDLPFRTKLAARLVVLDIALVRATDPSRRGPFRQLLRASISRLREELQMGGSSIGADSGRLYGCSKCHLPDDRRDLADIESGPLTFNAKSVAFPDLLPEIRRLYRAMAKHKGLEFAIEIEADVPPAIVTDPVRLQQLLRCLLDNTFESTWEGRVTLRIRRAEGSTPETTVIAFDVIHAGGIEGTRRGGDGAGPCLPVASRMAGLLGGRLALSGHAVSVYLPLVATERLRQRTNPEKSLECG